ncbi:hypothetical protein [Neisseria iguanae]|uniref:Uncharacterized protein n=1 Tax=Neisseria iguanae TaxID=90242 RepID=A0A2P7U1W7_9NEIS|nr:hypothetical protein [Neisseria iguanae]PSJ80968.1 hypothetical protein C7N83_03130 [Neisseria iguanae]
MIKTAGNLIIQAFWRFFANVYKKRPFCHQNSPVKNRRKNGRQRYKYPLCNTYLLTPKPTSPGLPAYGYTHGRQTCPQPAQRHHRNRKTIRRKTKQALSKPIQSEKTAANTILRPRVRCHGISEPAIAV